MKNKSSQIKSMLTALSKEQIPELWGKIANKMETDSFFGKKVDSPKKIKRKSNPFLRYGLTSACLFLTIFSIYIFKDYNKNPNSSIIPNTKSALLQKSGEIQSFKVLDTMTTFLDLSVIYKTNEEKFTDPEVVAVVEGEVVSSEFVNFENLPCTKSMVKIKTVFKGSTKPGETICVAERGGFVPAEIMYEMTDKDKFHSGKPYSGEKGVVKVLSGGYEFMQPSQRVILYLKIANKEAKKYFTDGELYTMAGAVQGKLLLKDGIYTSCTPKDIIDDKDKKAGNKSFTLEEFNMFAQKYKN